MNYKKKSSRWFLCLTLLLALTVFWGNQAVNAAEKPANPVQGQAEKKIAGDKAGEASANVKPGEEKKPQEAKPVEVPWIILLYVLILALVIAIPTITDICKAYQSRDANWKLLIDNAAKDNLSLEELRDLIKATSGGPPGISGMSRSLMAFAVIIILGIAVFHLLAFCSNPEYAKIVNNIMSMLAATLASITGFYFGGRSAEGAKEEKKEAPPAAPPPAPPKAPPATQPEAPPPAALPPPAAPGAADGGAAAGGGAGAEKPSPPEPEKGL